MRHSIPAVFGSVLGCLLPFNLASKSPDFGLERLIGDAEWVVVAQVNSRSSQPAFHDVYGAAEIVPVTVIEALKGEPFTIGGSDGEIVFIHRPHYASAPEVGEGSTCVFFMRVTEGGPVLVPGYLGALCADSDGLLPTLLIDGFPARTDLDDFTQHIREAISDPSRRRD